MKSITIEFYKRPFNQTEDPLCLVKWIKRRHNDHQEDEYCCWFREDGPDAVWHYASGQNTTWNYKNKNNCV